MQIVHGLGFQPFNLLEESYRAQLMLHHSRQSKTIPFFDNPVATGHSLILPRMPQPF
jgi:hypothetical protein